MQTAWAPIPGYEGLYEASSEGEIRSVARRNTRGGILAQRTHRNGRKIVSLSRNGVVTTHNVHRLVAAAFLGDPEGRQVCHNDGDPSHNRLANLRYGTASDNAQDALQHGTNKEASKTRCPSGHPYDESNTYIYPSTGHRACRTCRAARVVARRRRAA